MKLALIQFKDVGKKYYFSYENIDDLKINDFVVVETIKGFELGKVYNLKEINDKKLENEIKPIIRIAKEEDILEKEYNNKLESEVISMTKKLVTEEQLDMKILNAEYSLDRKRLTIHFESEGRVDFRNLVRELNKIYHTRIELRQIGSRDAAKLIGGIGPCGLILCCTSFLGEFDTVTIKMAKNQNIALNPQKISGVCGKLLCCIKYEDETYDELRNLLPDVGEDIIVDGYKTRVLSLDILGQKVKIREKDHEDFSWISYERIERI